MNYDKGKKIIEATAWNKIKKMFHPLYKFSYNKYDESSSAEQKYRAIENIIFDRHESIKAINKKHDRWQATKNRNSPGKIN